MDALLPSIISVSLAEMGDKTQLLALFLASRFPKKSSIILGIITATLANHILSAWFGVWVQQWLPDEIVKQIIGISFILIGLWVLIPDKEDSRHQSYLKLGAFLATSILFFLAEMGDKTQIATVLLAAKYQHVFNIVLGSTIGLLIANIPVIFLGNWLIKKLPLFTIRLAACTLFCLLGVITLISK